MADQQGNQRCEPCKYSKRNVCPAHCRFRPYFPPGSVEFRRVVDVYGDSTSRVLRNQMRRLPNIPPIEDTTYYANNPPIHDRAYFHALMVEVNARLGNRVTGSSGNEQALRLENSYLLQGQQELESQNDILRHENNWYRNQFPDANPPPFPNNQPPLQ